MFPLSSFLSLLTGFNALMQPYMFSNLIIFQFID